MFHKQLPNNDEQNNTNSNIIDKFNNYEQLSQTKYCPQSLFKNNRIYRYQSRLLQDQQIKSAILSQEQLIKLKKILLNVKVKIIRDQFIKKLKKKYYYKEFQQKKNIHVQHFCLCKGIQFSENIFNLSIAINLIATLTLLVIASFSATLQQFTQNYSTQPSVYFIKTICLIVLLLRILIHMLGHTFKNGQYLIYISEIIQNYLQTIDAYIDISTFLLLIFFIIYPQNQPLSIIIFIILTLLYMRAVSQTINLQSSYIHTKKMTLLCHLTKILLFNFILAHIVATILLGISHFDNDHNWIIKYGIQNQPWYQIYATSYYWGTIIVTTVGFGDIACGNWQQAIVVSILVIFTSMILGYNITQFNNIFSQYRSSTYKINKNIIIFKQIIIRDQNNNVQIDPMLKKYIYQHINEHNLNKSNLQFFQNKQFLLSLPQYFRNMYLKMANKRIFISVIFINQLKHSILSLLTQSFINYYIYPQQQIFNPINTINILQQGKIGLSYKKKGSTINNIIYDTIKVQKKQNLLLINSDFISLFHSNNYGYFGKNNCLIWSISIQHFINILKNDHMDFQYYYTILHKHPLDDDQWETIKCERCTSKSMIIKHNVFRCPQITYIPIRNLVIYRYLYDHHNKYQQRIPFLRNKQKKFRISVLKYYKNYFQIFVKEKIQIQVKQNYVLHSFHKVNLTHFRNFQLVFNQPHNLYYNQTEMILRTDYITNYQYYFPLHNACLLKLQPIDQKNRKNLVNNFSMTKFHPSHIEVK